VDVGNSGPLEWYPFVVVVDVRFHSYNCT